MEKKNRPQKISEEFKLSVIRDYYSRDYRLIPSL